MLFSLTVYYTTKTKTATTTYFGKDSQISIEPFLNIGNDVFDLTRKIIEKFSIFFPRTSTDVFQQSLTHSDGKIRSVVISVENLTFNIL
jgi:hypothetical protein